MSINLSDIYCKDNVTAVDLIVNIVAAFSVFVVNE